MSEMVERHRAEKHAVEPVAELGQLTVYYGRGSFQTQELDWCPTCQELYWRTVVHGHGIRESAQKWAQSKRDSEGRAAAARQAALAWRDRKRAEAVAE